MKTLFITPVGEINNLSPISFGVVRALENAGLNVAFIQPISQDENDRTNQYYETIFNKKAAKSIPYSEAEELIRKGRYEQILEDVIENIENINFKADVIVVEGLTDSTRNPFVDKLNLDIARTLCAGIIFSGNSGENSAADIAEYLDLQTDIFRYAQTWFAGYIINRVMNVDNVKNISELCYMDAAKALTQIGAIPEHKTPFNKPEELVEYIASKITTISLIEDLNDVRTKRMPPSIFRYSLIEKARKANKRIVLPEGNEPRTIQAATICAEKKIARCVLLGDETEIRSVAEKEGLTLHSDIEIIDPTTIREKYVAGFVERRKHRGATEESARESLEDNVVLGTMMLANNDVDGLVSGAVHTTADTIRPALQLIGTEEGSSIVSSVFFMLMEDQVHVYGDCAVNPNPTAEQLADIAIQSAQSAKTFGIEPKVAMISYSTGTSGAGKEVEKVANATKIAQEKAPSLLIDGPLQFDSACVPSVGKQKAPNSPVAGYATVFVFPDLNTGNTTYKAVQRSAKIVSIGPMLQGLAKPVNDLSRGALVDDIVYTIAITALQAMVK